MVRLIKFATSNGGKFLSVREIFDEYGLELEWLNISIPEPRGTLEEIALKKLEWERRLAEHLARGGGGEAGD